MDGPVNPDAIERVIQAIPVEVLKDCIDKYRSHGFTEDSALRFFRANLALAARRAIDTGLVCDVPDGTGPAV